MIKHIDKYLPFAEKISLILKHYLNEPSPAKRSIRGIAHYTGLNKNLVCDLINKKLDPLSVDELKLIKLLKFVNPNLDLGQILELDQKFKETFEARYAVLLENRAKSFTPSPINFADDLKSDETYLTYTLACNSSGTSLRQIERVLGERGLSSIQVLLQKNLIKMIGNRIFAQNNEAKAVILSREFIQEKIPFLSKFYKSANSGKKRNYIYLKTESVNEQTLQKLNDLSAEFHRRSAELINHESSKGSIPIYLNLMLDSFVDELSSPDLDLK